MLIQGVLLVLVAAAGWSLGPDWSGPLQVVGIVLGIGLIGGGVVLAIRGTADLGRALTPLPHPRPGVGLVDTGVYALVRHPIYGGLILGALGWSLIQASLMAVGLSVVLAAFFTLKARREEVWLVEHYPDYPAYRERTRRFIPWIY